MHADRQAGASFDPELIETMKTVLEASWNVLSPELRLRWDKSALASRILEAAASGERDPARLQTYALIAVVPSK